MGFNSLRCQVLISGQTNFVLGYKNIKHCKINYEKLSWDLTAKVNFKFYLNSSCQCGTMTQCHVNQLEILMRLACIKSRHWWVFSPCYLYFLTYNQAPWTILHEILWYMYASYQTLGKKSCCFQCCYRIWHELIHDIKHIYCYIIQW